MYLFNFVFVFTERLELLAFVIVTLVSLKCVCALGQKRLELLELVIGTTVALQCVCAFLSLPCMLQRTFSKEFLLRYQYHKFISAVTFQFVCPSTELFCNVLLPEDLSHEHSMFVFVQKDAEKCCFIIKISCAHFCDQTCMTKAVNELIGVD